MKSPSRFLRRTFLRQSGFAAIAASSMASFAQQEPSGSRAAQQDRKPSGPSLSRQFARWVAGLRYEDLPPSVIDRAKGVTLQALSSVLLGCQSPAGKEAVTLISEEEAGVRKGATIMVDGSKATKGGAAYANAEMALA